MPELTTRQRDLLQILLESEIPLGAIGGLEGEIINQEERAGIIEAKFDK